MGCSRSSFRIAAKGRGLAKRQEDLLREQLQKDRHGDRGPCHAAEWAEGRVAIMELDGAFR